MDRLIVIKDHMHDGIMQVDESGIIVFCNKKAAVLDGIEIEDVLGKPLLSVYPSLNRNTSTLLKVLQNGRPIYNIEQTFVTYHGKEITTINTTLPMMDHNRLVGAIEISHDITEVKAMSERLADLQRRMYMNKDKSSSAVGDNVRYDFDDILTQNTHLLKIKDMAKKAALLEAPVLVVGDTGTGKEMIVQAIHHNSKRFKAPFIAQNCAALPATLLEGILFGTVEGVYTGAKERAGLLETANGGTVFLDEINSMPLELQAKLLRFLQDGWLRRIGDNVSRHVDVRLVTAINMDPQKALQNHLLRSDLYYRLNTITLELPPLKARMDDLPLLIDHFVTKNNKKLGRKVRGVTEDVMSLMMTYSWPGNVRELEHVIEGAMSMVDGQWITLAELPSQVLKGLSKKALMQAEGDFETAVAQFEKQMIQQAMSSSGQNVTAAAKRLGLPRQTLQYKMKKLGLS